jgi:hypothetical protein
MFNVPPRGATFNVPPGGAAFDIPPGGVTFNIPPRGEKPSKTLRVYSYSCF